MSFPLNKHSVNVNVIVNFKKEMSIEELFSKYFVNVKVIIIIIIYF